MAIHPAPDTAPAAVLEAAREPLAALGERLPSGWTDEELLDGMAAVQRTRGALDALEMSMLAEVDVRELPKKRWQWASTADWFTHLVGGLRRDGRRRVRQAGVGVGLHRHPGRTRSTPSSHPSPRHPPRVVVTSTIDHLKGASTTGWATRARRDGQPWIRSRPRLESSVEMVPTPESRGR